MSGGLALGNFGHVTRRYPWRRYRLSRAQHRIKSPDPSRGLTTANKTNSAVRAESFAASSHPRAFLTYVDGKGTREGEGRGGRRDRGERFYNYSLIRNIVARSRARAIRSIRFSPAARLQTVSKSEQFRRIISPASRIIFL